LPIKTVAIMGVGDMGHAVGQALRESGFDVISCLNGRSEHSRNLAKVAGIRDVGNLELMVSESDIILSIMPPSAAEGFGNDIAAAINSLKSSGGSSPMFVECNAIAPDTTRRIGASITAAGAPYTDAGIIGSAPGRPGSPPRFYASGPDLGPITELDGKGIKVMPVGDEIGRATSVKMCYAGMTKGMTTLLTAVAIAAESLGITKELGAELASSQAAAYDGMKRAVPRLPLDSGRWIGEMEEIAATFASAGVTDKFHQAARDIFLLLDSTPFASETRQTFDTNRTLEDSVKVYVDHLGRGPAAAD
jgi:3-hydroxyisobutyrate dehydrogenase-like beta-hydroxyacid dehydrogenase